MVMIHTEKTQVKGSGGSKDRVETNRTDGQTDAINCFTFPADAVGYNDYSTETSYGLDWDRIKHRQAVSVTQKYFNKRFE